MAQVWTIPRAELPGFLERLARSLGGLAVIGGTFVVDAASVTLATAGGLPLPLGALALAGIALVNVGLFLASFALLTPGDATGRQLLPGAAVAAVGFTALTTVGSGLVQHQLRNSSATYGQFGLVIGLVGFLLLVAKLTLSAAELNPVLSQRLWPRSLDRDHPTDADHRVQSALVHRDVRRRDQPVGVGFGPTAADEVAAAGPATSRSAPTSPRPWPGR
jgi:hypothetical protein